MSDFLTALAVVLSTGVGSFIGVGMFYCCFETFIFKRFKRFLEQYDIVICKQVGTQKGNKK